MDQLHTSVVTAAREARASLGAGSELWLAFCRLTQLHRYDLHKVIDGKRQVNTATFIRIAAALEQVGIPTRLRYLVPEMKRVLLDFGLTDRADLKEYFPNTWDRASLQRHLCLGEPLSSPLLERIHAVAEQLKSGRISKKDKVPLTLVGAIKHELGSRQEQVLAPKAEPAKSEITPSTGRGQQSAAELGVVALNALATLFGQTIQPTEVSRRTQKDAALALTRISNAFGLNPDQPALNHQSSNSTR